MTNVDVHPVSDNVARLKDDLLTDLTPAQREAIDRLCRGRSVVTAAKAAGVNRKTVHRWLTADPGFRAAYNAWQSDALDLARARLLTLADDAISTVASSIHKGNAATALAVLKSLGALSKPRPAPTNSDALQRQADNARRAAEVRQAFDEDRAAMGYDPLPELDFD